MRLANLCIVGFLSWIVVDVNAQESPRAWPAQMQAIHRSLLGILPITTGQSFYSDPKRQEELERKTKELAEHAIGLKDLQPPGDADPTTKILAQLFGEYTQRARSELEQKHRGEARALLNNTPAFCVGCHTRTNQGPEFSRLGLEPPKQWPGMTDIEYARLLVALRLYGEAEKRYDVILHSIPEGGDSSGQWKSAVYGALTLAVRVRNDVERASEVIEHVLSRGFVPESFRNDVVRWKRALEEWKGESKRNVSDQETLIREMRRLHERAREVQLAPKDRGADLYFLRVSMLGHELLGRYPQSRFAPEALLLLGMSYEVMQTWDYWTFHEVIYERCVRQFPGSEIAGKCLRRLKRSIANDYIGQKTPAWQKARVLELEKLTRMKAQKQKGPN